MVWMFFDVLELAGSDLFVDIRCSLARTSRTYLRIDKYYLNIPDINRSLLSV